MPANLMMLSGISFSLALFLSIIKVYREVKKSNEKNKIVKYTFQQR